MEKGIPPESTPFRSFRSGAQADNRRTTVVPLSERQGSGVGGESELSGSGAEERFVLDDVVRDILSRPEPCGRGRSTVPGAAG